MMERLFALMLASILVAPQTAMANESEFRNDGGSKTTARFSGNLPLPPIPHLHTMPWIGFGAELKNPAPGLQLMSDFAALPILKDSTFATNNVGNAEARLGNIPAVDVRN